ncbi:MAG: MFS transporter [Candidatus Bipolaricaulota bacterium]|nr:MFS transporter [Candidatus Bipolaricaulota bacterium]
MNASNRERPWARTGLLFVGHAVNDGYGGLLAPLLPLLIQRLDLSLALAGFLGTIRIVTNSVLQPSLGHWIDRAPRPSFVVLGPLVTVIAMSFIGCAPSFALLVAVLLIAGVGTALFHPAAASLVTAGRPARAGIMMAFFSSGGTIGAALAPIVVVALTAGVSLERTAWLILPGIALVAAFAIPLRRVTPTRSETTRSRASAGPLPPRLAILWTAITLASLGATAFSTFLAVLVTERGGSTWVAGAAISAFLIGGAAMEFLAGNLSDRFGRRAVMLGSLTLAPPFLIALLHGPTALMLPCAAIAGAFSLAYSPVGIVAAHECVPGRTGLVSGLVMGLAWGVGGLALTPIGWLADRYGLVPVMTFVAFLPLAAAVLLVFYREPPRQRPADGTAEAKA